MHQRFQNFAGTVMDNRNHHANRENSSSPLEGISAWNFEENNAPDHLSPEGSADGIFVVQDGIIRLSNPAMTGISAYGLEEILDTCVSSFFDTEYMAAVQSLCEHILQDPDGPQMLEVTLVCKNGQRARTAITAIPCTFGQRPAILLKIRNLGFITSLSEGIAADCQDLLTGIVADPSPACCS